MDFSPHNAGRLVAVAMSGGVDSSVAALLCKNAGYRVVGLTMKLWSPPEERSEEGKTCCTLDSAFDAKRVCDQIGIPHYTLDMQADFEERVIRPFFNDYLEGRTPNPCVNCNSFVKWDALWAKARAIGAAFLATGHYAKTEVEAGRTFLCRAADAAKDQSYFLWGIPPDTLARTLFPLSGLDKAAVRRLAAEAKLRTAQKAESQDICFVPHGNYRIPLEAHAKREGVEVPKGALVDPDGKRIAEHQGLPFYTIGQRKGLGVATGEPVFVKKLDRATNTLVLGRKEDLYSTGFRADRVNLFGEMPDRFECLVQYRYRSPVKRAEVVREAEGGVRVRLLEPGYCLSPGQSAVFYDGDRLLGGARILEVLEG